MKKVTDQGGYRVAKAAKKGLSVRFAHGSKRVCVQKCWLKTLITR